MSSALEAIRRAPSDFAVTPDDIWDDRARPHVRGINEVALRAIDERIDAAERSPRSSVLGLPLVGEAGRGKSHSLGWSRDRVQRRGGFFVRFNILHLNDFWANLAASFVYALDMPHVHGPTGLAFLLRSLADRGGVSEDVNGKLLSDRRPDLPAVSQFIESIRALDPTLAGRRNTLWALLLLHANDERMASAGHAFLTGGEVDPEAVPGFSRPAPQPAQEIVRDLSQIMSLCGPTVIAVDQVDDIVRVSKHGSDAKRREGAGELLGMLGSGLTDVRDATRRSVVLLACLRHTWKEFSDSITSTGLQRFEQPVFLDDQLPNVDAAVNLLSAVLAPVYRDASFEPPYPSYPFSPECLRSAVYFSPRQLLNTAASHLRECIRLGEITEPDRLDDRPVTLISDSPTHTSTGHHLDRIFQDYRAAAEVGIAVAAETENFRMPQLLASGLRAYGIESDRDAESFSVTMSAGERQAFHAEAQDRSVDPVRRWVFKAIASSQGKSVLAKVTGLYQWARLGRDNPLAEDHGILWVTASPEKWGNWTTGAQVRQRVAEFERDGTVIMASVDDVRDFTALHRMESERVPGYEAWLRLRRPASRTVLFRAVFGDPPDPERRSLPVEPDDGPRQSRILDIPLPRVTASARAEGGSAEGGTIYVGALGDRATAQVGAVGASVRGQVVFSSATEFGPDEPDSRLPVARRGNRSEVHLDLDLLPKHTGIFAGSGSGKTVLLRRIIESAALQGISSIVLDPNNDLSRLGTPWPEAPGRWIDGDAEAAKAFFESVEVVVWTPGRSSGRPLSFRPLPDFAAVVGDRDEFEIAVDTAVASLVPRARIGRATTKDDHARAVLRESLAWYARSGSSDFGGYLDFLEELPDAASSIPKAVDIASQIASTLRAAMVNDRVFAGAGKPLDPGVLLAPANGKRARISIVNFIGLPTEEQRQGFVNQLELALFSWAKRNPAADRPLSGLFVLDEAQTLAPSSGSSICLDSTLALVSQARKYGLGMLFATQAPKGIHNRIVGNCATHWYGRINSPSQIAAASEVAQNKGGTAVDLAHLSAGQFYLSAEGHSTERVDVPMCLTHHPPTAPTAEEILAVVRRGGEEPAS